MSTLNIKDAETHRLAKQLARATGETLTEVVRQAIRERLERERAFAHRRRDRDLADWMTMARAIARKPELDPRSAGEIIGYDEFGLP